MSGNWLHNIKHVNPGEPVQAGVVSRPDRTLEDRTDYLKDRLDAASLGRVLVDSDATICSSVLPGQPVYWNWVERRYERALAAVAVDPITQTLTAQPSSSCVGICLKKRADTVGDIVLQGVVELAELQNAIDGPITPGQYWLSSDEAGKLVKYRPQIAVSVCHVQGPKDTCTTAPRVVIAVNSQDFTANHTHYRFELVMLPATPGAADLPGYGVVFDESGCLVTLPDADAAEAGWLPADHPVFNGKAPNNAKFGYNFTQHPQLAAAWPPIPLESVSLLYDRGNGLDDGATELPTGPNGKAICDLNGIWWLGSGCVGDLPFLVMPTTWPRPTRMWVCYTRMLHGTDIIPVTSLVKDVDGIAPVTEETPTATTVTSPIAITNCADDPAATGDLQLNLDLQIAAGDANGGQSLKGVVNRHQLLRGWMAEGAFTLSNQIAITGSRANPRTLTTQEKQQFNLTTTDPITLHQGILKIDYTDLLVEREISPQIIRLSDTVERLYMDIPYLGFPGGQASLLRLRFNVPSSNLGDNLRMKIRVQLFGRDGTQQQRKVMPSLYMTRRILKSPALTSVDGVALLTTDTPLNFNSSADLFIDRAITRDSDPFGDDENDRVEEGDTVLVTIGRAEDNVYGEIGVLRVTGIVYSAT